VKIAVVGGGVFGCTIAVDLARAGAKVDLYEARGTLLAGATGRCMTRIHRGYHYPRSDATAAACRSAAVEFEARFPEAVLRSGRHYYAIAPESKTSPDEFLAFCDRLELPYTVVQNPQHLRNVDLCIRGDEALIDVPVLSRRLLSDLRRGGVAVHLGRKVEPDNLPGYDLTVCATYGQPWIWPLRYEVCEVALLELGRYTGESFVVLDGEFTSLDPYGRLYALYDVAHSVHHANVGLAPDIPAEYADLLQRPAAVTPLSNFGKMVEAGGRFLWGLDAGGQHTSIYHRSMFSVRAVLPGVDATDARPTMLQREGNIIWVLSGKICTSVTAARRVTEMAMGLVAA
jgi:hypothetical protein